MIEGTEALPVNFQSHCCIQLASAGSPELSTEGSARVALASLHLFYQGWFGNDTNLGLELHSCRYRASNQTRSLRLI